MSVFLFQNEFTKLKFGLDLPTHYIADCLTFEDFENMFKTTRENFEDCESLDIIGYSFLKRFKKSVSWMFCYTVEVSSDQISASQLQFKE